MLQRRISSKLPHSVTKLVQHAAPLHVETDFHHLVVLLQCVSDNRECVSLILRKLLGCCMIVNLNKKI